MITILGVSGFIGGNLLRYLQGQQYEVFAPSRAADLHGRDLGDVIYCIGLTADFRQRPFATVDAHINKLAAILQHSQCSSLTYLSSTRVYQRVDHAVTEDAVLGVAPADPGDLYNLSKLMGESLALSTSAKTRVVRLSNVYGHDRDSDNFLPSIIREALVRKHISLRTSLDSSKDYIHIEDVVTALYRIATHGQHRIYNVASGHNDTNKAILEAISRHTGCTYAVSDDAATVKFPAISIERLQQEFAFTPRNLLDNIGELITHYRVQE